MPQDRSVKAFDRARRRLAREYRAQVKSGRTGGWRAVGARWGLSAAMANLIVRKGYVPKSSEIRRKLGMPVMGVGRMCSVHGVVHDKQCRAGRNHSTGPKRRMDWRGLALVAVGLLVKQ